MRNVLSVFGLCLGLALSCLPARAGPVEDDLVRQLRDQGYTRIEISRTWLGRSRIEATGPRYEREIIVNPRTGEILRDLWTLHEDNKGGKSLINPGYGPGYDDGEDDDRDDDDRDQDRGDDDRDDDGEDRSGSNSGSGGGDDGDDGDDGDNSGSGSGNSGSGGGGDDD